MRIAASTVVVLASLVTPAAAQSPPALRFNPRIPGFSGGAGEPSVWIADNASAMLAIYRFRPYEGDFAGHFRRTLLRDVVHDMQETGVAAPPAIQPVLVAGADTALMAQFVENYFGVPRPHLRIAILARGSVALIDYSAQGSDNYQRYLPGLVEMLKTLSVGAEAAPKAADGVASRAMQSLAGLYLGTGQQFVPNLVGPPGSGSMFVATRFYLLSPSGRVYRGYGVPKAPNGDISLFDYDTAARADPYNSGIVVLDGSRVVLRFAGGGAPDELISPLPPPGGPLTFNGTVFTRQPLR